jgi:hypothetical protein
MKQQEETSILRRRGREIRIKKRQESEYSFSYVISDTGRWMQDQFRPMAPISQATLNKQ